MSENLTAKNMNLLKLQRYQQHKDESSVRLGLPTWESAKLQGTLYDFETPIEEFLKIYSSQFDCVEYHQSFSDLPYESEMRKLKEIVQHNVNFRLCPVIPRRVSHEFTLGENYFDMKEFLHTVSILTNNLGPIILRLPETLAPEAWASVVRFVKRFPAEKRVAVHLTHAEWFKKTNCLFSLVEGLKGTVGSILIDDDYTVPLPVERLLCGDQLLVRFHGRPKIGQDEDRLAMWVYKLGEYKGYGIKNSYFFLYEEDEMCLPILKKMANSIGGEVRVPEKFDVNSNQTSFSF